MQPDPEFGYCLHRADLAVNKLLALAGRTEIRDFLDVLVLDQTYLGLGAIMWAACGKDPGYTPALLLDQTNRHARFQESDLKGENLARPVDFRELKRQWLAARERAEGLFARLPEEDLGCLYLDPNNEPVTPDPDSPAFTGLKRHLGSVGGAWPTISCQGRRRQATRPARQNRGRFSLVERLNRPRFSRRKWLRWAAAVPQQRAVVGRGCRP